MCEVRLYPIKAFKRLGTLCECGHTVERGQVVLLAGNETLWCSRFCFALATENEPTRELAGASR